MIISDLQMLLRCFYLLLLCGLDIVFPRVIVFLVLYAICRIALDP